MADDYGRFRVAVLEAGHEIATFGLTGYLAGEAVELDAARLDRVFRQLLPSASGIYEYRQSSDPYVPGAAGDDANGRL